MGRGGEIIDPILNRTGDCRNFDADMIATSPSDLKMGL